MVLAQKQTHRPRNRVESPDMDPQLYGQIIFDKAGKNIQWKTGSLSGVSSCKDTKPTELGPHHFDLIQT